MGQEVLLLPHTCLQHLGPPTLKLVAARLKLPVRKGFISGTAPLLERVACMLHLAQTWARGIPGQDLCAAAVPPPRGDLYCPVHIQPIPAGSMHLQLQGELVPSLKGLLLLLPAVACRKAAYPKHLKADGA